MTGGRLHAYSRLRLCGGVGVAALIVWSLMFLPFPVRKEGRFLESAKIAYNMPVSSNDCCNLISIGVAFCDTYCPALIDLCLFD